MKRGGRSKGWVFLMILVLLALVALVLFRYVFVVRDVEIVSDAGAEAADREAIIRAADIDFGGSIFLLDEAEIRRGVNSLARIRFEGVELHYPNALTLYVSHRQPAAMLLHMGDIRILDEECCVIESVSAVPNTDLIYVNGMTVTGYAPGEPLQAGAGQVEAYCSIVQALGDNQANNYVSEIDLSNPLDLRLITRSGITVELGDAKNMTDKIAWMKSAVADLQQRNEGGGTLDVRSGNKADYSRANAAPVATPAPAEPTAVPEG